MQIIIFISLIKFTFVLCQNSQFVINKQSNFMVFQFPCFDHGKQREVKVGAAPYDVDIQYYPNGTARQFVVVPRMFSTIDHVPFTLGTIPLHRDSQENAPIQAYPDLDWHENEPKCKRIYSAINIRIDACNRLWVVDGGIHDIKGTRVCQPKVLIFDLDTDQLIHRYEFPEDQIKSVSQRTSLGRIEVAINNNDCHDTIAYISDFYQPALLVYDYSNDISWRIKHDTFAVEDQWSQFSFKKDKIILPFGITSITLTPNTGFRNEPRYLIYRSLAAENEYIVPMNLLNDRNVWANGTSANYNVDGFFQYIGTRGHRCSSGAMDSNFNYFCVMDDEGTLSVWNFKRPEMGTTLIAQDEKYLKDLGNLKIIRAPDGHDEIYFVKTATIEMLTGHYDPNKFNFFVASCRVSDILNGRKCTTYMCPNGYCSR